MPTAPPERFLDRLILKHLDSNPDAGLCITSLPLPRRANASLHLAGRPTYAKPLGQWYDVSEPSPRRVLLIADSGGSAPAELTLSRQATATAAAPPTATAELFAQSDDPEFHWERHMLRLAWNGRRIGLIMGMRVGKELRWWEFCRLVTLRRTDTCVEVQMAGSIPHELCTGDLMRQYKGVTHPGLHRHHWLSGHIYARLHANGVCEIYARHVNSKFFDDGLPLHDAVPVVAFHTDSQADDDLPLGAWNGQQKQITLGGVRLDLTDASHLATEGQPGRFDREEGFTVWQPYLGMELFGGTCPQQRTGDPYIFHAEQKVIPRGMSRTLRFSLSLNPQRSPRVARYLAPAWWYGLCEEFTTRPYLPVSDKFDARLKGCQTYLREHSHKGGFEDGSLPRGIGQPIEGRHEPGWEGEAAGVGLMLAYRTGEAIDYDLALRAAYCFNDVYVDHAAKAVRMHGYPPNAFSVPMNRMHAGVYLWLETGDPFGLDAARAVTESSLWTHKNSWPRVAVGRDACFVRAAMLIYRYTGEEHYLNIARNMVADIAESQMAEGCFGDQGGGSGIHGWGSYIVKPWMGLMAVGGVLDYLELFPDGDVMSETASACVKKFADWLMRERHDHKGVMGWSYQHLYNGKREFRFMQTGAQAKLPTPSLWYMDYLARLMTFCAIRYNDPSYYDAFVEAQEADSDKCGGDHGFAQSVQYLPWAQAMAWRAQLDDKGDVVADPLPIGTRAPKSGVVVGPNGPMTIERPALQPAAVST